ncbi:hypothetical protein MRB53_005471 [Persea americana]|uniref:Uncharacterized protein n=1 Tax=Persea americana TaxID=3435 RepID=A0ACC2ME97_PERAE|nr:hypothetical protein MRB53_005471 [Persea americana]
MASPLLSIMLCLFLSLTIPVKSDEKFVKQWCTADEKFPDEDLQKNLDWACSSGAANCKAIQENQPCYFPNTVKDHASYAFNSYWQNSKKQGATCDFHGAAVLTEKDPSHASCIFEYVP